MVSKCKLRRNVLKIGLIDVDGHNFPNLPLMKLSAWHKQNGNIAEWYDPIRALTEGEYDKVYMSKVFTFTPDYDNQIYAKIIMRGGTGYIRNEKSEHYEYKILFAGQWEDASFVGRNEIQIDYDTYSVIYQKDLSTEIEHIYPDYDLYGITDTAYGFLTRGCPKGNLHKYCIVSQKEGYCSHKVADLSEFWNGQKNIVLLDPNITACKDCNSLFQQLIDSKVWIDFSQGLDMQLMTEEKAELLKRMKIKTVHFALDNWNEYESAIPKFKAFKEITGWDKRKMGVFVLTNYDTTHEQDLERIYALRDLGYHPYVMIYEKEKTSPKDTVRKLQRWVNSKIIFEKIHRFEDYIA
jgi:hypothetical protein